MEAMMPQGWDTHFSSAPPQQASSDSDSSDSDSDDLAAAPAANAAGSDSDSDGASPAYGAAAAAGDEDDDSDSSSDAGSRNDKLYFLRHPPDYCIQHDSVLQSCPPFYHTQWSSTHSAKVCLPVLML